MSGPQERQKLTSKAEKDIRLIRSKVKNVKRNLLNMTGRQLAKLFKKTN